MFPFCNILSSKQKANNSLGSDFADKFIETKKGKIEGVLLIYSKKLFLPRDVSKGSCLNKHRFATNIYKPIYHEY